MLEDLGLHLESLLGGVIICARTHQQPQLSGGPLGFWYVIEVVPELKPSLRSNSRLAL